MTHVAGLSVCAPSETHAARSVEEALAVGEVTPLLWSTVTQRRRVSDYVGRWWQQVLDRILAGRAPMREWLARLRIFESNQESVGQDASVALTLENPRCSFLWVHCRCAAAGAWRFMPRTHLQVCVILDGRRWNVTLKKRLGRLVFNSYH